MQLILVRLLTLLACSLMLSTAYGQASAPVRTLRVTGQGEVQAEPDRATLVLGVESRQPSLQEARAAVTRTVDAVLKLTREMKIDPKRVRTTRINVRPEYDWNNPAQQQRLLGYHLSRQVEVELHEFEQLGVLIERAVDLGVNQIGEPQLDSSRRQALEREALARAVADARQNAEVVAKAVGARVGPARTVNAASQSAPPRPIPLERNLVRTAAADAAESYQGGELSFMASVEIEYDLLAQDGQ